MLVLPFHAHYDSLLLMPREKLVHVVQIGVQQRSQEF